MKKRVDPLKRSCCSIGIIGGADGPAAVFAGHSNEEAEKKWAQVLEECRKLAVPIVHAKTGEELMQYLIKEYDAREIEISERQKIAVKINVLLKYFPDLMPRHEFPQNQDKEALMEWASQMHEDLWNRAQMVPDEKYGLKFVSLTIPKTEKTARYYEILELEQRKHLEKHRPLWSRLFRKHEREPNPIISYMVFDIETSTGYMQMRNGCHALMNEIILWKGITQEDIDNCTPEFMSYAAAMRDMGKI